MIWHFFILTLCVSFVWETIRYACETFVPSWFELTRAVHPLVVAGVALALVWPHYILALAIAAAVGILHVGVERFAGSSQVVTQLQLPRRRGRDGLPPLP